MSRRSHEHDHYGHVPPADAVVSDYSLFSQPPEEPRIPAWAETWGSLTPAQRLAQRARWKELMLPYVLELSQRTAPPGVTASEAITEGIARQHLWGEPSFLSKYPRIYSWVGSWLAQLAAQGMMTVKTARVEGHGVIKLRRESDRDLSHGNEGIIYVRAA